MQDSDLVSVIVRAHNEEERIHRCLESFLNQTHAFHLIVVDNASTDSTPDWIQEFLDENSGISAEVVYEPKKGRGTALKTGVKHAKTGIVATLDGDSYTTQPDWLENLVSPFTENPEIVAASGRVRFYDGPFHHRWLYDIFRSVIYTISAYKGEGWLSFSNSAFRKHVFDKAVAGIDLNGEFPDDRIAALEMRSYGKIVYVPEADVCTAAWLPRKKYWGTQLIDELDHIHEIVGGPESDFHKVIRYVSLICSKWDKLKQRAPNVSRV